MRYTYNTTNYKICCHYCDYLFISVSDVASVYGVDNNVNTNFYCAPQTTLTEFDCQFYLYIFYYSCCLNLHTLFSQTCIIC